ncbi:hypothetical protein D6T64_20085 [Cryobacterium melibiosiphilum]|uniref:Fibronectin type-III domain-containing protein n=1 Tax=Cryobacterium melibiosiphilum TaxID=995039 RepID=A0A3A5M8D5_9MICO|nr:hypothetical protein [Cryobacterium melibiosiphilum]RJT85220.1 hypothetical protein D6T64_20085 [Cryobacterium melibiosiphilum]
MFPQHRTRTSRALLIGAAAIAIALAGAGTAQATWSTFASTTASVASGKVSVSQTGFAALDIDYTSQAQTIVKPVTIVNGNVPATYTAVLSVASSSGSLASKVSVSTWNAATSPCAGTIPASATTGSWSLTTRNLTGTLAAGASATYCVSATLPSAVTATSTKQTVTAQLSLSAAAGTWTAAAPAATAVQTLTDNVAPRAPGRPCINSVTDASITMDWRAPEGGQLTYNVYRDGGTTPVGTATSTASGATVVFTDTGLSVGSTHSYTVQAVDAAGNASAKSPSTTAETSSLPSENATYQVRNNGLCVAGGTAGTPLTMAACNGSAAQAWKYTLRSSHNSWSYSVLGASTNVAWDRSNSPVRAATYSSASSWQKWSAEFGQNGQFSFTNGGDQCLTVSGSTLVMLTCTDANEAAQVFTIWRVG